MSNTVRPRTPAKAPVRKVTRSSEEKREATLDNGLRIIVEGDPYDVRLGDVTPALARELRRELGIGPLQLITAVATQPDVDLLSAFVWLARRIKGEVVRLDDVAVTYEQFLSDGFDVDIPGGSDDDPET